MRDELARRLVHASGTVLPAGYLLDVVTWEQFRLLLAAGTAVALALEAIRLGVGLDWWIYEHLTREYEQENLAGYALYTAGATAAALAFPPAVAVPAILMLTVGDPISGLLGSGELKAAKRARVLLAMFGVCTLIASFFLPATAAILGGAAATLADGVKPVVRGYVIDDNLTIPVGAAVAMFAAVTYLPVLP
ncbi:dolichol kinase [Halobacteriales archaeon QS_1_68_17]|nr:MAG: dolichol kinase [Halobacteriales archaeon QS_1_68_17]